MSQARLGLAAMAAATLMVLASMASSADEGPAPLAVTRIYSDTQGVSHFRVEKLDFKALGGTNGEASLNRPDQLMMHVLEGAQGATFLRLQRGATEDWH